jgi:hypothetical protein
MLARVAWRPWSSSALLALALWSAPAAAQAPVSLDWQAPPGCPGPEPVLEKLTELVGPEPLAASRYHTIRGRIGADSRLGWRLVLELSDGEGTRERTLSARKCEDLASAAAVALALVLEPDAALEPEWQAAAPVASPPAMAKPAATAPTPPTELATRASPSDDGAVTEPEHRPTPMLGVGALVDSAALGGASLGLEVHGAARLDRWSLGLSGVYLPGHQTDVRADGQWVELALLAAGPRVCHRLLTGAVRADACAGFELGRLTATGVGLRGARETSDWWLSPSLGLGLDWLLFSDVSLAAHVDGLTPLAREEYVINETEAVHRVPAALLRVGLGVKIAPE